MCGLGLPDIMDLARTLRRSLVSAESEARGAVVAVSDLSRAVRAWSHSGGTVDTGGGEREELPQVWTGSSTAYIDALCEVTAGGTHTGEVPWRR